MKQPKVPDGYIDESMFFNPRKENTTYYVRDGDLFLYPDFYDAETTEVNPTWVLAREPFIGMDFKDVLKQSRFTAIAIPMKYKFNMNGIHSLSGYFDWSCLGIGFGQFSFRRDKETGQVVFETECMSPTATRKILHEFVDFIVDNGMSDDWKES